MVRYHNTKTEIKMTVDIQRGPASPAQEQAWKRFWRKLISEVKAGERWNPKPESNDDAE